MSSFLDRLNPRQREAAAFVSGPLLILAGAGTGKTRTLTFRIAQLLATGVSAEHILAVTFTNKAAREMRERVAALLPRERSRGLTLCTFHALCARILRAHADRRGYTEHFAIMDGADQRALLRQCLGEVSMSGERAALESVQQRISRAKNRGLSPSQMAAQAQDDEDEVAALVYRRYRASLKSYDAMDFDDLLLEAVALLEEDEAARDAWRARSRYQLVDEFQDTNALQLRLVRALAGDPPQVCVVGDDDQSIYGWRGAVARNLVEFERMFPGARRIVLDRNYRSPNAILRLANAVIAHNPGRYEKRLFSELGEGARPELWLCPGDREEAALVIDDIRRRKADSGRPWNESAVLLRANSQSRPFEEKLRLERIPYVLIGGTRFFDRKEVRDVLAYLKFLANARDDRSLLRVINTPARGIGKTTVERLVKDAARARRPLWGCVRDPGVVEGLSEVQRGKLAAFADLCDAARANFQRRPLPEAFDLLIDAVDWKAALARESPTEAEARKRYAFVQELRQSLEEYCRATPRAPTLAGFLEDAALLNDGDFRKSDAKAAPDAVTLITLHSAKGLEYPVVYLVGIEEGRFPHQRALAESDGDDAEERRLFYVGVTRARERLVFTACEKRHRYGAERPCPLSRFLGEIDDALYDVRHMTTDGDAASASAEAPGAGDLALQEALDAMARRREQGRR